MSQEPFIVHETVKHPARVFLALSRLVEFIAQGPFLYFYIYALKT